MYWDETLRLFNSLGCLFSLWLLGTSSFRHWHEWNAKTKAHWWAFFGFLFFGFEASAEAIITNASPGPRILLQSIIIIWTIRSLLLHGDIIISTDLPWEKDKDKHEV